MKCPKCHYLSFDPEPRCRNCGFSLGLEAPDLPMAKDEAVDAPLDLELRSLVAPGPTPAMPLMPAAESSLIETNGRSLSDAGASAVAATSTTAPSPRPVRRVPVPRLERPRTRLDAEERDAAIAGPVAPLETPVPTPARVPPPPTTELPLFVKGFSESAVLLEAAEEVTTLSPVPLPTPERTPIAVARLAPIATPKPEPVAPSAPPVSPAPVVVEAAREPDPIPIAPVATVTTVQWSAESQAPQMWSANRRKLGPLDRDLLSGVERIEKDEEKKAREKARALRLPDAAGAARRLAAAVVDGLLLSGILAGLLTVTLRWTAIEWANLAELPLWPTVAFLTLIAAGYLLLFTAFAGQTPGKMLLGIRVVGAGTNGEGTEPLSASQACLRELVAFPAVLLLGLGFLPALVGNERGLHDRIASTRVVRG